MSQQPLRLHAPRLAPTGPRDRWPLGRYLVENGVISPGQLLLALHQQQRHGAPIGGILRAEGWASAKAIRAALAQQHGLQTADLARQPPDPALARRLQVEYWLDASVLPWMRLGSLVLIATAHPDRFDALRPTLEETFGSVLPVVADEDQIQTAIGGIFRSRLAADASTRVALEQSCRGWTPRNRMRIGAAILLGLSALTAIPVLSLTIATAIAVLSLALFLGLRLAGAVAYALNRGRHTDQSPAPACPRPHLPKVSVLVPLYKEKEIAGALIRRLGRLSYPKALLEVLLVLEEHDAVTRRALAAVALPPWMRVIEVPAHRGLTTKPRAMNYALNFCKGEIIGVWDAEDAPAPDQIEHVAARFAAAPAEVVCLQGILDYYNPRSNWRSRCFTIEYASWFRVILPGIARLGLVVPLGGTTLYFRRAALEQLGGWDAHNVTEDADLGVRLCRAGYRTEAIDTVTFEEAACRAWPWVKQRSRWLKGFMVTYLVHMRAPARLWSDLGAWRFLGFQAFFLGTLGQFLLAPLMWSYWLLALGMPHPVAATMPAPVLHAVIALTISAETLFMIIAAAAVSSPPRRFLMGWLPTMIFYFPLGILAAYKAMFELFFRPFHWEKTQHGQAASDCPAAAAVPVAAPAQPDLFRPRARAVRHPVSTGS